MFKFYSGSDITLLNVDAKVSSFLEYISIYSPWKMNEIDIEDVYKSHPVHIHMLFMQFR